MVTGGDTNGTWADTDGSGANIIDWTAVDFDGVTTGTYTFTYTLTDVSGICGDVSYEVEILVQDCACPNVATIAPTSGLCNDSGTLDLSTLQVTTELGTWAITNTPVGSNPATFTGTTFDATGADAGDYELTFTLDAAPLTSCPDSSVQILTVQAAVSAGTGSSEDVCNDDATPIDLFSKLTNADAGGIWSLTSGTLDIGVFDATNGTFTPLNQSAGTFEFDYTLSASGPCGSDISTVTINVVASPTTTLTTDANTCNASADGSIIDLTSLVTGGDTNGTWADTDGSGANIIDWTAVDFDGVTTGTYTFTYTLTDVSGICGDVSYEVEILVQDCACPNVATIAPTSGLCNGSGTLDLTTLQSTAESGSWQAIESSTGTIVPLTGDTTFDATGLSAGEYTLTFTLDAAPIPNCPDSSVQVLTVQQAVSAGIGSSQPACNNEIASIDLKGFISGFSLGGSWVELSGGIDNGGFDAANGTFTADGQSAGTLQFGYVVTATAPCENDTAFVNIEVVAPSSAEVTTNTTVCDSSISPQGSILNLMGLIVSGDTNGTWADTDGSGANIIDWTAVDFDSVTAGEYTFTYTLTDVSGICGDVSYGVEILVQNCACPNVATKTPVDGLCNDSGTLDLTTLQSTAESGSWQAIESSTGTIVPLTGDTTFDATGLSAGEYTLTFTLDAAPIPNCPDSSVQVLTVQQAVSAGIGSSQPACNNEIASIDLKGFISGFSLGGSWVELSGGIDNGGFDAANGTFTADGQSAGTLQFGYVVTATAPCENDTAFVNIEVVAPSSAEVTTNTTVCDSSISPQGSILNLMGLIVSGDTNGTWVDTDGSGANMGDWTAVDFDSVTAGEYTFTYTLTDVSGICGDVSYGVEILVQNCACPNVATKTPVDGLCNDSGTLDLTTLQSTAESGSWQAIESSTGTIVPLTGDTTFDATGLSAGEYTLTFTLDAAPIPNCPDSSVQVLTVQQAVSAGIGSSQPACNNEIASIDLKGFISGFSLGGSWVELSGGIDNGGFDAANGTFTADGQSAGTLQFGYVVTATAPCENDTAFVNIEVVAPSSAEVTTNTTVCDSSISPQGSILNLMGLIVSGDTNGTWADTDGSGANIIDWTAVDFDGVTTGTYTFTYTLTDVSGICGDVSYEVEILVQDCACPNVATIAPTSGLCNDSGTLDLSTLQVTTELGTWAITNTPVGSNPATFTGTTFDATGADAGDYELTFTLDAAPLTSCPDSSVQILTVQAAVSAGTGSSEDVCNDDATPIDLFSKLTNADAGGIWSLTSGTLDIGVFDATNGTFTPLNQSAGTFEFSYTLSASGPCGSDISTVTINVVASPTATLTTDANTCNVSADGSIIDLTSLVTGGDSNGTWADTDGSGANIIDWTAVDFDGVTTGTYTFTYTLTDVSGICGDVSYEVEILVQDCACPNVATIAPTSGLCNDSGTLDLSTLQVTTELGTWAITNTPVGSNPATFTGTTFDATGADAGDYELTFTLDAAPLTSCPDSSVQILTVQAAVSAGTGSSEDVCNDDATPIDLFSKLTNADAGGIWSLTSGTLDIGVFDATNGTFTPLNQSAGTFEFSYTLSASGPCGSDISTVTINVVASPTATLTTDANTCNVSADGSIIDLTSLVTGGDSNGTWADTDGSGANIIDWTAVDFDGVTTGTYTFTYTLTDVSGICGDVSYEVEILVQDCACPNVATIAPTSGLCNDSGTLDLSTLQVTTELGTWAITNTPVGSNPATFTGTTFDATGADAGDYELTFTLDAAPLTSCPDSSVQILTVQAAVSAGTGSSEDVCNDDATPIDLFSKLTNADAGGIWSLTSGTLDIGVFDATNGTFTPLNQSTGTFEFSYTLSASGLVGAISRLLPSTL
ncbi:MAG: hypothetical protein R3E32_14145 [Chitinophagales bacterium]